MDKKDVKRRRMWAYFIEATAAIIEEEGYDHITIRKIADKAGYNSATIYNYFSELSHLTFFASMRFLKPYTSAFINTIDDNKSIIEQYLNGWECFCEFSYQNPRLFHTIFLMNIREEPKDLFKQYYDLYEADIVEFPNSLKPALYERNVAIRGESLLKAAADKGEIPHSKVKTISTMTTLIWQGMLTSILNRQTSLTSNEAKQETMISIRNIVYHAHLFETIT